jgi:hypothetical protein
MTIICKDTLYFQNIEKIISPYDYFSGVLVYKDFIFFIIGSKNKFLMTDQNVFKKFTFYHLEIPDTIVFRGKKCLHWECRYNNKWEMIKSR